jgi:hypothetical protein
MPGTSAKEAARIVAGELPGFVHVVELPARGPGADMAGRTGGLLSLVDPGFGMETTPDGWRFGGSHSKAMRRAVSLLGEDLDALEETTQGYRGPVKAQVVGPWTMAAAVELPGGERALKDEGAVWEIAQALAEAVRVHVADLRRRIPGASVVLQIDEPGLPAVLQGRIGTASGLSSYRAVEPAPAERALREVLHAATEAGALAGVHCCAAGVPLPLIASSGAQFASLDVTALDAAADDALGQWWESGRVVLAGAVPSTGSGRLTEAGASAPLRDVLHRLGLEDERWLAQIGITPTCGLAAASPAWTRTALAACRSVGRVLRHDEEREDRDET